jgi:uncharacterized protein involved in exopolysaccharide biosynthesis
MESQPYVQENEIDLRDYINVIIKRKKLILGIFILAAFLAVVVNLALPKIYEITSTIQLGNMNELLIKDEDAKAIILNQNSLLSVINSLNLKLTVDDLQQHIKISDIKDTDLIKVKVTYTDIDTALKINNAVAATLIAQGQYIYKEIKAIALERLGELNAAIRNAEGDIVRTQKLITEVPSSNNLSPAEASLRMIILQNTLPEFENNLSELRRQRNELQLLLSKSKDFKVFDEPIRPQKPVGPKIKQNVIFAGMISLIFGIFLAFALESWQKIKE